MAFRTLTGLTRRRAPFGVSGGVFQTHAAAAATPHGVSRAFAGLTLDPHTLADFEDTDITPPGLGNYYNRHKTLLTLFDQEPDTAIDSYVAPSAALIGRVTIQDRSSVGYGCVLRADTNYIHVGAYSHILDGTTVQVKLDSNGAPGGTVVGNYATIGPNCMLSTCLIDNRAFVGAGSIIQDHSWVAEYAMLAPGSVLPAFSYIPPGQVWAGNPVRYIRDVTDEEKAFIKETAHESHELAQAHAAEFALEDASQPFAELAELREEYRAAMAKAYGK